MIAVGAKYPNIISAVWKDGKETTLDWTSLIGHWTVVYFYPKDNTPGCTMEGLDFEDLLPEFQKLNSHVIGVSTDSIKSHEKFSCKHSLSFPLISDMEKELHAYFDTWALKMLYGKQNYGTVRSTFIFNAEGVLVHVFDKVKAAGHAEAVLKWIQENQ